MTPRSPEQFEQMRTDRKAAILKAALHVFAEDGYHLASVSKIAKKAGVSKGLMYNYFDGKQALLYSIMDDMMELFTSLFVITEGEQLTQKKFIGFIELSIDFVTEDMERWKLYFSLTTQKDVVPIVMEKMMPKVEPYMAAVMDYFARNGAEDPMTTMRFFSAVLDGVQMHIMFDPENFPVEKVKKMIIDQFA